MTKLTLFFCGLIAFPLICSAQDELTNSDKRKLEQRFNSDKQYALYKRKGYEASKAIVSYVGENIKSLTEDWGPATRTVDNGDGEMVYVYEQEVQSSGGSYTPGTVSVTSDAYSVTVSETEGKDTRYNHSHTVVREVSVENNIITHIERSLKAFPDQRPETNNVIQTELTFSNKGKEMLTKKVVALIKSKKYTVLSKRLYNKKSNEITYRSFDRVCTSATCGSDLYSITYVKLVIDSAGMKVKVDQAMYSSILGARMLMDDMGMVVTENDEPFNLYKIMVPKAYEKIYPECMFDHKGNIRNQFIHDTVKKQYEQFVKEITAAVNN